MALLIKPNGDPTDRRPISLRLRGGRFGSGKGSRRHTISAAGQRDPRLLEEGLVLGTVEAGLGRKVRRVGTDRILCQRILVLCKVLASGPGGGPVPSGDAGRMDRNVDLCNHGRSRQQLQYNNLLTQKHNACSTAAASQKESKAKSRIEVPEGLEPEPMPSITSYT